MHFAYLASSKRFEHLNPEQGSEEIPEMCDAYRVLQEWFPIHRKLKRIRVNTKHDLFVDRLLQKDIFQGSYHQSDDSGFLATEEVRSQFDQY